MIKTKQTELHTEISNGNCWIACIASILELDIDKFPSPNEFKNEEWINYHNRVIDCLNELGYDYEIYTINQYIPKSELVIAVGKSPRGNFNHAVIWDDCKGIVHDPHPDNTGINSIEFFERIVIKK